MQAKRKLSSLSRHDFIPSLLVYFYLRGVLLLAVCTYERQIDIVSTG